MVSLSVGLPPEHFGVLKDKFKDYFARDEVIRFSYNHIPYAIRIRNIIVSPQAYAACVPYATEVKQYPRLFVIDIGGYTTDVLMLANGKPNLQFCRSLEDGIITMNNEIVRKVNALYDLSIDEGHIADVLAGRPTILDDKVQELIKKELGLHTRNILNKLRELQVDLRSNPAIFVGGGSLLLRSYIEKSSAVVKATFIEDANANAKGYQLLGTATLKKLREQNSNG